MKKILLLLLIAILLKCDYDYTEEYDYDMVIEDFISANIAKSKTGYIQRKTDVIIETALKYGLDPLFIDRVCSVESSYRHWKVNKSSGCIGMMMISPPHWNLLLWKIDNGKLGKHLIKNNITNINRYWKRIAYNVEGGCYVISNYLKRYNGDIYKTMKIYSGNMIKRALLNPQEWIDHSNKLFNVNNY